MAGLEKFLRQVRFAGFGNVLRAARYRLYKERLDRPYRRPPDPAPTHQPGRLLSTREVPGGAAFEFEHAALEIVFLAPDLARLTWGPGLPPLPYALARTAWPLQETRLAPEGGEWFLGSANLHVWICPDGSLRFQAPQGHLLHQELPPRRAALGEQVSWSAVSALQPGESLFGLGEHTGRIDLVGQVHRLWNSSPGGSYGPGQDPLYAPAPVVLGLHPAGSYLIFYENPFPAAFAAGRGRMRPDGLFDIQASTDPEAGQAAAGIHVSQFTFTGGLLRYYFIPGTPAQALERFTELTGRPDLPPRWSLGYHQSRWGYKTANEIRSVLAGFEQHQMPLSAIHLDIDYMDGYRVFQVDHARFPDLSGLADELHAQGVRLVTIVDPGVKADRGYTLYREGLQERAFCTLPNGRPLVAPVWPGSTVFPDFTHPDVRAWWGDQYPRLLEAGVDGFWHDMNEPEAFSAWGDMTLPLATRHHLEGRGGDHRQAHNLYGLLMNRAGYEGLRRRRPLRRPWLISRSGWAGSPRYAWNWTGDVESTWGGLRLTIAALLGLGLSGQPFCGADIGGFSGDPDPELYLRWFQAAAFLPFFRTHSAVGTARREPWVYGEPYTTHLRQSLQLRYRLLPYFYTLAWEAAQAGCPLVRPLFWDTPQDSRLWAVDDTFLLGEALLVAPILEPGATVREVLLPAGRWYSLWDATPYEAPGPQRLPASLERIPVLARGGTLLPMETAGGLDFHVYPGGAAGEFSTRIYTDAGDGYPASSADWRIDRLVQRREPGSLELAWETDGDFPFPYRSVEIYLHGCTATRAWIDGKPAALSAGRLETGIFRSLRVEAN